MRDAPNTAGPGPAAVPVVAPPRTPRVRLLLAALCGAALAAAFAPLNLWPLGFLCPAVLIWLWQGVSPREGARLGFAFTTATFIAGTYWLYYSIHVLGQAPIWLALALMLALAAIMGLYHAALGYACARWLPPSGAVRWLVAVPGAWLVVEWWRGWFLGGFSWLSLGYSQSDTWLAGYAPLLGVYGMSALLLVMAGAIAMLVLERAPRARLVAAVVLVLPWLGGAALYRHSWTVPAGAPVSVAVIQGAIPQDEKWLESNRDYTLNLYQTMTEQVLGTKLIVWPESAPADLANELVPYISNLYRETRAHGSTLVTGILRADPGPEAEPRYYNSVLSMDAKPEWYDKAHLVPFAEFFPVPAFVRQWLKLRSLPYSDFTPGAAVQPALDAAGLKLGTTICYEDAYGSAMLPVLRQADALVNVTNDAWFGHTSARHQHLQISRLRALEAGRYMVRAANDGISAVLGPHGEVIARAAEFVPTKLVSSIIPMQGLTPYARVGNYPVVMLALLALAYGLWVRNDRRRRPQGLGRAGSSLDSSGSGS
ncbi:MAG TPA: apolipoprotein N-acyltransferase [Steroidobacteraceae bacterium]|nr:apolipoprotein N-acyltransferase [Steroidobacteraceae bacterium]